MLNHTRQDAASPWHAGELAMQRSVGVVERMDGPGRNFVRKAMPEQHRAFFPMLPFVVLGTVDAKGDVWATVRADRPGFMSSPHPEVLDVDLARDPADPADAGMADGDAIAMLGIQLETRRRNRLNGVIRRTDAGAFSVRVGQSFGNCPQYIQLRSSAFVRDPQVPTARQPLHSSRLDERARQMIEGADTFFVASYVDRENGERQVDVSHRGGNTGFVRVGADGVLTIPDFAGNLFFNTLGNFLVNPKAGLVFVDFETGDILQMTGKAEVLLDSPDIAAFQGAERLWRFTPESIVLRLDALPLRWSFDGWSPNSQMTGNWQEAGDRLRAAALAEQWRPFRIVRTVKESETIRSLHLEPADGVGLIAHLAGQHLPVRVTVAGEILTRRYTLSSAPSDGVYRISVRRQGHVSTHLHGLKVGDLIEARAPAGAFTIDAAAPRPAVLLAAGVGITPMLAMLRHLVYEGHRTRHMRPVWLFQAAKAAGDRAFAAEIASLVAAGGGDVRLVRVLGSAEGATSGKDYEVTGRIDAELLQRALPFGDYDFYLCGPGPFMQSLYDGLRALNVPDNRIHAEAFGPSALKRASDAGAEFAGKPASTGPVHVVFARSGKEARWQPGGGTLLELAEARGLSPEFGCRGGSCGSCAARILEGAVSYAERPSFPVEDGEALICCAVPAEGEGGRLHIDL